MKNSILLAALILCGSQAHARSIECTGVVYQGETSISTDQPSEFKQYGLDADLYVTVAHQSGQPLYIDLQKLNESETASTLELTYVWCPKATPTAGWCGKAVRVLQIDKASGGAQFFNRQEDGSNYPVSTVLTCKVN